MTLPGIEDKLDKIRQQKWFYEFVLPDGTKTESYLPQEARQIHRTRETALREYLEGGMKKFGSVESAFDISCHEGFFSAVLAEFFPVVKGIDKNLDSITKARQIAEVICDKEIQFTVSTLEDWPIADGADFVLCFGLLYHVENPVEVIRRLADLTRKAVCIETQVLPFQMTGRIEDGHYMWQRDLKGLFGLCVDYSSSKEGGRTDLAMVPSSDALVSLLESFGFGNIRFYEPRPEDYEQFVRRSRVILFAEKLGDGR